MASGMKQRQQSRHHFVLVHGVCHGAWSWYKVATLLSSAGHRVTALDMAACGASPLRAEEVASFEEYSRPLLDAVAGLPPDEKAVLVGHSFGGQSLALAMERYPDRVAVAVFVSAAMPAAGKPMNNVFEQVTRDCIVLMENGSVAYVLGTGTVDLKFTSGKIVRLKNVRHVPSMNKNLVCGSLLLKDGFKAVSYGLIIHQMDVKTAFLNGELKEEIYMERLDGFVVKGQESKVCKLLKSLYSLEQAPKQWHEKFDITLTSAGFAVNGADSCVYYRYGGGKGVILCPYVDDILIFGTMVDVINEVKSFLSTKFDMKDAGETDVILNIKLIKDESGITLSQTHYVEKVLSRFGYIDSKPSPTPYDPSVTLKKNKRIGVNQLKYSQIIGSLMYLASATGPDISFAGTMSYSIHYSGHLAVLDGYSDANISDDELYATSGYVFMLGGGAVSWSGDPQHPVEILQFGPQYLEKRLYQLSPPEVDGPSSHRRAASSDGAMQDLTLAMALVRPSRQFREDETLNGAAVLTAERYSAVSRVCIVAEEDAAWSADFQRRMASWNPGTEVRGLQGADHMPMLSKPRELAQLLMETADKYT
ncbi:hypothetical protein U9M48_016587 [Paspalum notatum var. saurae]|uniref:AB hydrolase-1 domain-containing protein n=1 Tax=Paspalum notatum var. saurae TaxID=547442 RepID=A0AAQ3WNA3_PASNO